MNLYNLTGQYLEALDFLTDPENEIDQQTAVDTMEGLDGDIEPKMLNVARAILELEHLAEGIKEARKRMESRQKAAENRAEWLRNYLVSAMERTGKTKVSDAYNALSLAKKPPHVVIDDEDEIPEFFKSMKEVWSVKKDVIKEYGGCPGAHIEAGGYRVSIK